MTSSQGGSKSQQVNNHIKSECLGNVNGFVSSEPVSQGDNELRNSKGDENPQNGCNQVAVEGNTAPQPPPPQSLVHWERFLHVRSIKVMLVENDDCTRYIVTAFLRNCNYEVIEAANGFQAWKILENLSNHIDIVLTEVVMPCLSGVSLLCKIMSHKTRKNIPVIMMSSHGSMGLVFKCLSKGAVDFLVKPIRKNEIKNLWQHVWRRCHSSSGSGSESGVQPQKSVNSKNNLRYDNNGSKDRDDNGSTSGSGTESSWRKHARESPEAASLSNHDHLDSACAIVIRPVQTQEQPYTDNDGKFKERPKISEMHIENGKAEKIMNANTNGVKRAWESNNDGKQVQNGCNILRHSEVSAFTRYKSTSNPVKGTPGITATCSQPDKRSSSEQVTPRNADVAHDELRVHHIHHHHHVHHYHNIDADPPLLSNHDDLGSNNLACGSSNIVGRPGPANLENYSLNRSGSGSKHGSNLQNGSNPAVNIEVTKVENDEKSEIGCLNRLDQRKAALTKFRQKRELRCFQKKVRYQNRKRLAEQRPRVRGQFVKGNSSTNATDG